MTLNVDNCIVGGGLVGSLLAIALKRQGLNGAVFEQRADMRMQIMDGGRSINLVITSRGIHALKTLGIDGPILKQTVPVTGRMMHGRDGLRTYQPYGTEAHHRNYSVSRAELNKTLMTYAESEGVPFYFEHRLHSADLEKKQAQFETHSSKQVVSFQRLFGTDGGGSQSRTILKQHLSQKFSETQDILPASYKELMIPATHAGDLEKNVLHIWPRGAHMVMALPNLDGSFTVTLYLNTKGPLSFESLKTTSEVTDFFKSHYESLIPYVPNLVTDFIKNPTGLLGTVRCFPWSHKDSLLLLGDAAHAIVPFFGQGMNAGFEDVTELISMIAENTSNWMTVFEKFFLARKPNADAIADMALENFTEMRDRVGDPSFLLMKQVEQLLEKEFPDHFKSRYVRVTQTLEPYASALKAGLRQERILKDLCSGLKHAQDFDRKKAAELLKSSS